MVSAREFIDTPDEEHRWTRSSKELRGLARAGTYVVTSAQNNCPPEEPFLDALEGYCKERGAELLVIPIRYKNPTSRLDPQEEKSAQDSDGDYWWHPRLHRYMLEEELRVHPQLSIMGNVKIQATAANPLREAVWSRTQDRSAIFGHSQLAMQTVATRQDSLPKILYTTGSVTRKNYSDTLSGDLASFHHSHSAIVVEVRGKRFYLREITWDGESFIDAGTSRVYRPRRKSVAAPRIHALITGDTHAWFADPAVVKATYSAKDSICAVLRPERLVWHDVFDGFSISHHHEQNRLLAAAKAEMGLDSLEDELEHLIEFVNGVTPASAESVFVHSNHNSWLEKWLQSARHVQPRNLRLWHQLSADLLEAYEESPAGPRFPDPLAMYCEKRMKRARFLGPDESYELEGVELGMHGHLGPNGARGSVRNLSRVGVRSVIGHVHGPAIFKGLHAVGTSSYLRLGYNAGPSGWLQSHCALHANGKRQMLHVVDGRWRG